MASAETATGGSPRARSRSASSIATSVLPTAVGPKSASSNLGLRGARGQELLARERGRGGVRDHHLDELSGPRQPAEVDRLVVARPAAQLRRIRTARSFDQHLLLGAD